MTTKEIADFIIAKIENGTSIIVSGEIHSELKLTKRMPMVCSAMRNLTKIYKHEFLDDHTPSGQTSTLAIKFSI
jgi:hypothetical protein